MKRGIQLVVAMSLFILIVTMMSMSAWAYTIDGDMSDWGVNLSANWSLEATWVPSSPTAYWIVEDNIDCSQYYSSANYCGVHITGIGMSSTHYAEPKVILQSGGWTVRSYNQPYHERGWAAHARELNDIEAIYFDTNVTHAFFAILTSIPPDTVMGDLAIELAGNPNTGNYGYEYGIVLNGANKNDVYQNPKWSDTDRFKGSGPYRVTGGALVGTAEVVYTDTGILDYGSTNWVIEIRVPKSVFGNFDRFGKLHTTLYCGNDVVEISGSHCKECEVPEFTYIVIPLGATLGLFYYYHRKRRR
ncbi:MAG: hypothetical protein WAV32_08065 [Halobacteriota archaeon]